MESIKILNDRDTAIEEIYTKECSKSLNEMLAAKEDEESTNKKVGCSVKFTIKMFHFIIKIVVFRLKKSQDIK